MKHIVYVLLIVVSIVTTYKVTSEMTQELMGAFFIQKHITDHQVHLRLSYAVEQGDDAKIESIANGLVRGDIGIMKTLISSLEEGQFTYFTKAEVEKGNMYLESVATNVE